MVPHMQVCQAPCRSHGLAAILDFLKNLTWPVTANVCMDHTLFMQSILVQLLPKVLFGEKLLHLISFVLEKKYT